MATETKDALNDEIDELVLKHSLCMEVGYEEGDIVPLVRPSVVSGPLLVGFDVQRPAFVGE
jgi:hypothetical protein